MRIYLAARGGRRDELARHRVTLAALGHVVTSRWLDAPDTPDDQRSEENACELAAMCLEDIGRSDVLVLFSDPIGTPGADRGGHAVELGFAFSLSALRTVVIGPRKSVFMFLCDHYFETFKDAIASRHAWLP